MASSRSFGERVRRNHALEHATLHVLAREMPDMSLLGRSDWRGFALYGNVDTESVRAAVEEAYERLQRGERHLAVHPHCGTNMAVTGLLTGAAVLLGLWATQRERRARWPLTIMAAVGAFSLATPLGPEVQRRYTTNPDMSGVHVAEVRCSRQGRMPVHQIIIEHEG
jgi:hypothetical protein